MKLYLVRHGQAKDANIDPNRALTEKGILSVERVAKFLSSSDISIDSFFSSNKLRAFQTAEILRDSLKSGCEVKKIEGIAPNDSVESFVKNFEFKGNTMLVGHLPFLSRLVSLLLTDDPSLVKIKQNTGSVVCLEKSEAKTWQLLYSFNPELILKL